MFHIALIMCAFFFSFFGVFFSGTRDGTEKRLFQKLFKDYNPSPRPTSSALIPVSVKFGVALNQILDMVRKIIVQ